MKPLVAVILAMLPLMLQGCFPYVTNYVYVDGPDDVQPIHICTGIGPRSGVRYLRNGVNFYVSLEPGISSHSPDPSLRVLSPQGTVISIPDPAVKVLLRGEPSSRSATLVLKEEPRDRSRFIRPGPTLSTLRFVFVGLGEISAPGTLTLPVIYVNGAAVQLPPISFERRSYAGVLPLNC